MSYEMTRHDLRIVESVKMTLSEYPAAIDGLDTTIHFQFPPKITSDGKGAIWDKGSMPSYEPIYLFGGAEPRSIQLTAEYVVNGALTPIGGPWTTENISKLVHNTKAHLYRGI